MKVSLISKIIGSKDVVKSLRAPAEERRRQREGGRERKGEGLINVLAVINGLSVAITNCGCVFNNWPVTLALYSSG